MKFISSEREDDFTIIHGTAGFAAFGSSTSGYLKPFHLFTFLTSFFFIFFLFITNFVQSKPILTYDCNPKTIDAYRNYSFFKRSICHWRNGRKSYKVR